MTYTVNATVIDTPPPPPPPKTVQLTMPITLAEALRSLMNYSPICEAFNELVEPGEHQGKQFQWDGTPAHSIYYALLNAGIRERHMASAVLSKVNT